MRTNSTNLSHVTTYMKHYSDFILMQKGQSWRITVTLRSEVPSTWVELINDRCDSVKCENVDGVMFGSARVKAAQQAARHRAAEWATASATLRAAGTRPPRTTTARPAHASRLYLYLILVHACNANDFLTVMGLGLWDILFPTRG